MPDSTSFLKIVILAEICTANSDLKGTIAFSAFRFPNIVESLVVSAV